MTTLDDDEDADVIDGELAEADTGTAVERRRAAVVPVRITLAEPASDHPLDGLYNIVGNVIRIAFHAMSCLVLALDRNVNRFLDRLAGTRVSWIVGGGGAVFIIFLVIKVTGAIF